MAQNPTGAPPTPRSLRCQSGHEGHCPFVLTECPACKGLVRLGEKEHHLEHTCPERSLSCRHCRAPCCSADMKVSAHARRLGGSWRPRVGGKLARGDGSVRPRHPRSRSASSLPGFTLNRPQTPCGFIWKLSLVCEGRATFPWVISRLELHRRPEVTSELGAHVSGVCPCGSRGSAGSGPRRPPPPAPPPRCLQVSLPSAFPCGCLFPSAVCLLK